MVVDRVCMAQRLHGEKQHQEQGSNGQFGPTVVHAGSVIQALIGVHMARGYQPKALSCSEIAASAWEAGARIH